MVFGFILLAPNIFPADYVDFALDGISILRSRLFLSSSK